MAHYSEITFPDLAGKDRTVKLSYFSFGNRGQGTLVGQGSTESHPDTVNVVHEITIAFPMTENGPAIYLVADETKTFPNVSVAVIESTEKILRARVFYDFYNVGMNGYSISGSHGVEGTSNHVLFTYGRIKWTPVK